MQKSLTSILVTQFLLHLQQAATQVLKVDSRNSLYISQSGTPSFVAQRVIGSIGHIESQHGIQSQSEGEMHSMDIMLKNVSTEVAGIDHGVAEELTSLVV